jgi:TolA-binding protein|tara:strand:+ start:133 stop:363 length:231 start_codon:yes stop_codon:yes gene_type:complete
MEYKNMTQLNDEHFEVIEKNKVERYERQKLTFLEDRIKTLEIAIESHAKILARFQMTEGKEAREKEYRKEILGEQI